MQSNGNGFCGPPGCSGNGEIKLPYGSVEYVALGSSCFFMMLFVEMFGNPFMKNCNVVISLLFGYIVACFASLSPEHPKAVGFGFGTGVSCKNGTGFVCPTFNYEDAAGFASLSDLKDGISAGKTACSDACPGFSYTPACSSVPAKFNPCDLDLSGSLDYVTSQKIGLAPMFTFLWAETFPLGFYAPALVPLMIGVLVSTIESIGDINASCDASKLKPPGVSRTGAKPKTDEEYEIEVNSRVQGGLLADGVNSFFAAWMTQLPNTTYSQNNGVIALTNCGSKAAGIACGIWLILFGVFAKVAAIITSIPDCVLGGVTTFLFANVVVSGIRILLDDPDFISGGRRSRAILAISLGLGLGVTMKPGMVEGALSQSFMYGIWPKASECMSFCNTVDGVQTCGGWQNTCVKDDIPWTSTARPDECDYDFGDDTYGYLDAADTCNAAPGCVFVPKVMTWHLWNGVTNCVEWNGMRSFRDGMILILKTPNCIGPLVALLLNLILPVDKDDETAEAVEDGTAETTTPPSA
jgi:xanthine/uracil permease